MMFKDRIKQLREDRQIPQCQFLRKVSANRTCSSFVAIGEEKKVASEAVKIIKKYQHIKLNEYEYIRENFRRN
ncbi:hypothetical protein FACS189474_1930 [Bacteroidia bacterium]|nr:hypothetical protein FACS189474_1930 [Bacteroidia bacterium]